MLKSIYSTRQARFTSVLKKIRLRIGMKQVELAYKLGRPQSFVAKIESGERRVDFIEMYEICQALGISMRQFVAEFEREFKSAKSE